MEKETPEDENRERYPDPNFMKKFKKYSPTYSSNESSVPGIDNDYATDRGGTEQWVGLRNLGADKPPEVHDRAFKPEAQVIREALMEILDAASDVDASDIEVDVENGIVSLDGTVPADEMKRLIENYAASVPGVASVENRLVTHRRSLSRMGNNSSRSNEDLTPPR